MRLKWYGWYAASMVGVVVWLASILAARFVIHWVGADSEFYNSVEAWAMALAWSPWFMAVGAGLVVIVLHLFGGGERGR